MATLTQTISYNLTSLSDTDLFQYASTLLSGLPKVQQYEEIVPEVAKAQGVIAQYGTAIANFAKGGQAVRMERDSLRPPVEQIIRDWSDFALARTPESPLLWAQAHFMLTKDARTPRPAPGAPSLFKVSDGPVKGSVELRQNAQAGTKAYIYEYALVPLDGEPVQWHYCLGTTAKCIISNLLSGRQYQFRVAAWNGIGDTVYSQPELRYVQ